MAPSTNLALIFMGTAIFLATSSFLAPVLFFCKKIYYRGDVNISTMNSSLRQGILLTTGILVMLIFQILKISEQQLTLMLWATIGCIEVMAQAID
ncbi:hypothetical protein KGV55_01700 [Candidatus Gracilibacteria bacterium]|nr:hypothetical protein [Candidatus Gracilibacteria bacterium]